MDSREWIVMGETRIKCLERYLGPRETKLQENDKVTQC